MDILDEHLHLAHDCALLYFATLLLLVANLVAREGFAENVHKRTVSGKKHTVQLAGFIDMSRGRVQSNQGFARSRNTGDKANGLASVLPGRTDNLCYRI